MSAAPQLLPGLLLDLILALVVLEGLVLHLFHRRTGRGIAPRLFIPNLLSGAGLLLALRGVMTGAGVGWILAGLALALVAHVLDLRARLGHA